MNKLELLFSCKNKKVSLLNMVTFMLKNLRRSNKKEEKLKNKEDKLKLLVDAKVDNLENKERIINPNNL